jgi:hypothetical protein
LNDIMLDPAANAGHKIDSIKVLDQLADNGAQTATAAARFNIVINLGADADGGVGYQLEAAGRRRAMDLILRATGP